MICLAVIGICMYLGPDTHINKHTFVSRDIIHVGDGPIALLGRLGWLVSGPVETDATRESTHANLAINCFNEPRFLTVRMID